MPNNNNPFHIPDLTQMYEAVRDFVKEHQGKKGYILTEPAQDETLYDTIWGFTYNESERQAEEAQVKAVRVSKDNELQVILDQYAIWDDESVKNVGEDYDCIFGCWANVEYDDCVYFIPTIFNIAENIQQYIK